jgi:hypothetical protein
MHPRFSTLLIALGPSLGLGDRLEAQHLFGIHSDPGGRKYLAIIDTSTGSLTHVGVTGFTSDGLAFAPDGRLFAADNDQERLVTLDPMSGAVASVIGPYDGGGGLIEGLAFHPQTGTLYGIDVLVDNLVTLDTTTGQVTTIGRFQSGSSYMAGLTWSPGGAVLYAVNWGTGCLHQVDPTTGAASPIGCGDGMEMLGLAAHPTTGRLFTVEWHGGGGVDMTLARINPNNGNRVVIGTTVGADQIEGLSFGPAGPGTSYCTANPNSTGFAAGVSSLGSASVTAGDLKLFAAPVPDQNGLFFHGANATQVPFGNGLLCASGNLRRGDIVFAINNTATISYDNSTPKRSLTAFVGTNRKFQNWFRDPMGGGASFNTSNAVAIDILP